MRGDSQGCSSPHSQQQVEMGVLTPEGGRESSQLRPPRDRLPLSQEALDRKLQPLPILSLAPGSCSGRLAARWTLNSALLFPSCNTWLLYSHTMHTPPPPLFVPTSLLGDSGLLGQGWPCPISVIFFQDLLEAEVQHGTRCSRLFGPGTVQTTPVPADSCPPVPQHSARTS